MIGHELARVKRVRQWEVDVDHLQSDRKDILQYKAFSVPGYSINEGMCHGSMRPCCNTTLSTSRLSIHLCRITDNPMIVYI